MRNLNECQAEVFRRSEKRIKERKQRRKHMIMACIPLMLCITLFSAFLLPGMIPDAPQAPGMAEAVLDGSTENKSESLACPIAEITISGLGFSKTYTNTSDILRISCQLYTCGGRDPAYNGATGTDNLSDVYEENADDLGSITGSANAGYTITLVTQEGKKNGYYLVGSTLEDLNTNQTHTLSQKQLNELKDLLGIPRS